MIRSALALHQDVDALLLPRVVEMDSFLMCPNFRAFPDIVVLNTKNLSSNEKKPILSPTIELKNNKELKSIAEETVEELNQIFDSTSWPKEVEKIESSRNPIIAKKTDIQHQDLSKTIALIGHPYVLADKRLNNGIPETLNLYGYHTVFSNDVPFEELSSLAGSFDYYAKKMYWRSAREIIGAFLFFSNTHPSAGIIHLAPFNCGIDALLRIELMSMHKKIEGAPPFMTIVCDEHTQRDHVVTRIEAFLDMIYGINIK
jgi:predicted nucleotide-binding protein (sugar kinase/HSP70/actin superfamily)